ncbi:15314_t:CDS:2 [Funneliformis geosporum]|nr:15314_t:CDS:2 [Funneliformis geosporum]
MRLSIPFSSTSNMIFSLERLLMLVEFELLKIVLLIIKIPYFEPLERALSHQLGQRRHGFDFCRLTGIEIDTFDNFNEFSSDAERLSSHVHKHFLIDGELLHFFPKVVLESLCKMFYKESSKILINKPKAMAVAIATLIMRSELKPAISPASFYVEKLLRV